MTGHPYEPDRPLASSGRVYDPRQRQAATDLQREHPGWLVMYGAWSRLLWAFSAFATIDGKSVIVACRHAAELSDRMTLIEQARRAR
jgi:hypothetical protein